ncbi:ankyrin repeat-containing domain protein [Pyrenochaeta sp. MPI-SDFR-AT-0127]|nr:ankyrin repeat-containing domain protein [Pyrenochaeta sp. MPI-SDFR-AT-0127]
MEHAITSGNLEGVVAILCKHPAEHPNNSPDLLLGTFPNAARNNHPDILLYLCENREPHFLSQCAESTAILQLFVDFGWDINESDTGVHHPRFAQFVHDEHLTRWLLSIGADPTARADYDVTATSIAAIHSSFSIFELLLERSGNVDNGQLLHRAIKRDDPDQLEFIELLLDLGCPIDAIQYENHPWSRMMHKAIGAGTPLFDAAARGKTDVVKYLRQRGANPAIKNTHGKTVLQIAEEGGHIEIVDIIKGWDH